MRTSPWRTAVVAGAIGVATLGGGAAAVWAQESPAPSPSTATQDTSRLDRLTQALAGLVTDGTITQAQADAVAQRLDEQLPRREGRGHHGGHGKGPGRGGGVALGTAAETLGMTTEELRTALRDGQTLAQVAESRGVERAALLDALVAAAEERLATAVTEGRITQEQADARRADLREHLDEHLDRAPRR